MKHLIFFSLITSSLLFNSCKKPILGCTDTLASNYDESAVKDNGDCKYAADILFWYNSNGSSVTYSSSDVKFLLDGNSLGTSSASLGHTIAPTCDSTDVVKFNYDMAKNKSGIYTLQIRAASDNALIYTEVLNLVAAKCNIIELN